MVRIVGILDVVLRRSGGRTCVLRLRRLHRDVVVEGDRVNFKDGSLEEWTVPGNFMVCTNDSCGVELYDPRRDVTGSCPGCDEIGRRVDGK